MSDLFNTITGADWRALFARSKNRVNRIAAQLRATIFPGAEQNGRRAFSAASSTAKTALPAGPNLPAGAGELAAVVSGSDADGGQSNFQSEQISNAPVAALHREELDSPVMAGKSAL